MFICFHVRSLDGARPLSETTAVKFRHINEAYVARGHLRANHTRRRSPVYFIVVVIPLFTLTGRNKGLARMRWLVGWSTKK